MERTSTPLKFATTYSYSNGRISSEDMRNRARKESLGCIFGDIPEFLEKFFPVDQLAKGQQTGESRIEEIMAKLKAKNLFQESPPKWNHVPMTGVEDVLYTPLLEISQTINELSVPKCPNIQWRDIHSTAPRSVHEQKDRPDLAALSKFPGTFRKRKTHWHNILLPVEVKTEWDDEDLKQLLGYVRVMLREQWNRRFTYGLLYTGQDFQVWLFDRSGAIGSPRINFHEHPRKLVCVLAGLTAMTPAQLGYDTTMTLIKRSDTDEADAEWMVDSPDGNEKFLIFEPMSLSRSQVIVGRATRVWKAWRKVDMEHPAADRPVYILKDTWRDDRRCLEGDLYTAAGEGIGLAQLYCHGAVYIDGFVDTTADLIRRNVRPPKNSVPRLARVATQISSSNGSTDMRSIPSPTSRVKKGYVESKLHGRTHSRTIMSTYGWPIHRFASLREVIKTLEFALKGHRHLWQRGVLHRDISPGNILITHDNRGALIDLDYAIDKANHKTLASDERTGTLPYMSSEIILDEPLMNQKEKVEHGPQHDLESFFWVLCWLATHYDMPGHMKATEDLSNKVSQLFSPVSTARELALTKKLFFLLPDSFDAIREDIAPYFRPLEGTLRSWMEKLRDFYQEKDRLSRAGAPPTALPAMLRELHTYFLEALCRVDGAVVNDDIEDQYKMATERELKRRQVDLLPPSVREVESMDVDG